MKYEKVIGYGSTAASNFEMDTNKHLVYREKVILKLFCNFDFSTYPFDSHECHLTFCDEKFDDSVVRYRQLNAYFAAHRTIQITFMILRKLQHS